MDSQCAAVTTMCVSRAALVVAVTVGAPAAAALSEA
jgi:hypothetical protein